MSQTIFSDGVADVVVVGGVVRIDFFTLVRDPSTKLQAQTSGDEPPPMQRNREVAVAIPIPAFLASYNILGSSRNRVGEVRV